MDLVFQLLASVTTIVSVYAYGSKSLWGPRIALVSQVFWWLIMLHAGLWGLLPLNVVMLIIHVRNYMKWRIEV